MKEIHADVNQFPSLTWNFLNINRTHLDCAVHSAAEPSIGRIPEGIAFSRSKEACNVQSGLGAEFDAQLDAVLSRRGIASQLFTVASHSQCLPLKLEFTAREGESSVSDVVIAASPQSQSTFIFVYRSPSVFSEGSALFFGSRIRVRAEENAQVHIVTVNLLGGNAVHFNSIGSHCADGAAVEITELELGGEQTFSGTHNVLAGYRSRFLGRVSYAVRNAAVLDMNQAVIHTGRSSESRFTVDGVLMDSAQKTWRGTISFENGCTDSAGDEQEDALLLSPDAVNKSLPVILCGEEAVEGRHGCSAGKIGAKELFYMQSRGADEQTVRSLLANAKVEKSVRFIPDESLAEEVRSFAERVVQCSGPADCAKMDAAPGACVEKRE